MYTAAFAVIYFCNVCFGKCLLNYVRAVARGSVVFAEKLTWSALASQWKSGARCVAQLCADLMKHPEATRVPNCECGLSLACPSKAQQFSYELHECLSTGMRMRCVGLESSGTLRRTRINGARTFLPVPDENDLGRRRCFVSGTCDLDPS